MFNNISGIPITICSSIKDGDVKKFCKDSKYGYERPCIFVEDEVTRLVMNQKTLDKLIKTSKEK